MTEDLIDAVPTEVEVTLTVEKDGKTYYVTHNEYDLDNGRGKLWIELKPINPMLLRMAMSAVKIPKRPTYEAKTAGGRVEHHPLDEVSALDNPSDNARWQMYIEEREEAMGERTNASMRATFYYGTVMTPPNNGWDDEQEMLGIEVPSKPELRKAHYLMSTLTVADMNGLMRAITRNMGISEEGIEAAEDSFRGPVRN